MTDSCIDLPRPRLYASSGVTEGYCELQELERKATVHAMMENGEAVELWYRGLTLYRRGMLGTWDFSHLGECDPELAVRQLQSQLLGLGLSSAKAALDLLLAGYYSVSFAANRHMLESFAHFLYVDANRSETRHWYTQPGGLATKTDPARMKIMVQDFIAHLDAAKPEDRDLYDELYASWRLMSKGSHPSGAGITQTEGDAVGRFFFGAAYQPDLSLVGFDHGLFAVTLLLPWALNRARGQTDTWVAEWEQLRSDVSAWREARATEIAEAEGELPPEPPGVPRLTSDDVARARRTIARWETEANAWKAPLRHPSGTCCGCRLNSEVVREVINVGPVGVRRSFH